MTNGSRGPYKSGVESRRRLVETAIHVFGERGYRGGSLRMIAEAVDAPASQIINLFGSKDGLLVAVLDRWDALQVENTELSGLPYVDALRARIRYSHENPAWVEFLITLSAEATAPGHPAHDYFVDRYRHITDRLQEEIARAAETGQISALTGPEARAEAHRLSAMMDGLQLQWLLDREFDLVAAFDGYLDALIARWRGA
ncbi:TetR/AcrR family transcriptional regulator [Labedella phragmitis]|uniref:TetR/AcrR family transcriptional regulator n=1 Tax=Labedella phragmitis TaxID=2498849 RepID=A0A3S5CFF4_9MICO|nr:TetR/AcrR family transcriptional regulator [Labedella phragmitis]RWZ52885.1 TetR/AcrR family transcriptional regulator [Labedella phragmitis]